jgi:hypothetical protein
MRLQDISKNNGLQNYHKQSVSRVLMNCMILLDAPCAQGLEQEKISYSQSMTH